MKNTKFLWYFILFALLFATSCSKDDEETPPPAINEAETLVTFLESTNSPLGKDFVNSDMPTMIDASAVYQDVVGGTDITIVDIRSAGDYDTLGHIAGAVNVSAGAVLDYLETQGIAKDKKIVTVCYTGQTAGWVTSILRLNGFSNAFDMKWGMCSWHADFASKWLNTIANGNAYATQFISTATDKAAAGSLPSLTTGKTNGQEIFDARVTAVLAEGFSPATVTKDVVFNNLSSYYIVNYWPAAHYSEPGHIPGAMQYTPKESIKLAVDLKTLPTDKPIVVYCYTGQTSAFLTAYLRILGYDAKSLLFGANGMIYDKLVDNGLTHFDESYINDYPTVTE